MKFKNEHYQLAKVIKLIIFDVDGVLTDGGLYFTDEGIELKRFNALDGQGIKMIKDFGIEPAVITARSSLSVSARIKNLNISHYYQGQNDKLVAFNDLSNKLAISPNKVAYVGDDIIDLPIMKKVGLAIAVANAHELVKENCHITTSKIGGYGAVREICDFLLKAQGKYNKAVAVYLK